MSRLNGIGEIFQFLIIFCSFGIVMYALCESMVKKVFPDIDSIEKDAKKFKKLSAELEMAEKIQKSMLPEAGPSNLKRDDLEIYASSVAAEKVGGDFYDFFRLDDDRIGLVIADVSGKGVPAALFMAVSNTLLRSISMTKDNSQDCIDELNRLLCRVNVNSMFVTVFYGILNHRTGELDYTNGGHNPAYILRGKNGELERYLTREKR